MWMVSTRSAAATWKEDQEDAHLPATKGWATLPLYVIFIFFSTDSTLLLFQQICLVQMSVSHQIFPHPLKNQYPIYFLTNRRKEGVLQERLYTTASSSPALTPCSSGMLGWIPSHTSDSLMFILSLCSKTVTGTDLNSTCTEVSADFDTKAKKARVRLLFLYRILHIFLILFNLFCQNQLHTFGDSKVQSWAYYILKLFKCLTPICKKDNSYEHDVFRCATSFP